MVDVVIRGDAVVTPHDVGAYDIGISGSRIVAVTLPGGISAPSAKLIDATGKIVIPGGVDPHTHCAWPIPVGLSDPPAIVSRAALHGGTTTIIDFALIKHGTPVQSAIEMRDQEWKGQCYCDYAYHMIVEGEFLPDMPAQLAEAIQSGYATIKIFTTNVVPSRRGRMVDFGSIWEVFRVLSSSRGLGVIHAEDNDIVMYMYGKLIREGRTGFENMSEVHNTLSEDLSFRRIIRLAENVPGTALYMMHVSAASGVAAVREARGKGLPIYGETLHQYLCYSQADYRRPNGQIYHTYPSLKDTEDRNALWDGMLDGTISTVATDEICCALAGKVQGKRIDDVTGGNAGCEPRVSLMYTEMVGKRGYSLRRFVDLVSSNAAKIMGLYPRKGAIAPGSDADIVLLDPTLRRILRKEDLHETDYSPWEGHEVHVWPSMTMLRGKVVVEEGKFLATPGGGQWQSRKITDAIIAGAAL